jgi:hypothetical protein
MVYDPKIQVFDSRPVKENLIGYIEANQAEALAWANNGSSLDPIRAFYKSPRLVKLFPALTFIQAEYTSDYEDLLTADFSILFEVAAIHGNMDTLTDRMPKYAMALESLLTNIPNTTLFQNSIIQMAIARAAVQTTFDVQGQYKNQFIEVFQMRASWRVLASAY